MESAGPQVLLGRPNPTVQPFYETERRIAFQMEDGLLSVVGSMRSSNPGRGRTGPGPLVPRVCVPREAVVLGMVEDAERGSVTARRDTSEHLERPRVGRGVVDDDSTLSSGALARGDAASADRGRCTRARTRPFSWKTSPVLKNGVTIAAAGLISDSIGQRGRRVLEPGPVGGDGCRAYWVSAGSITG